MKKRVSTLALALILLFSISAAAAAPRNVNPINHKANIVASSSGVVCSVSITVQPGTKVTVSGKVTLYRDDSYVTSWSVSSLKFNQTYTPVLRGGYRMDYDITVKGDAGTDRLTGSESDTY